MRKRRQFGRQVVAFGATQRRGRREQVQAERIVVTQPTMRL